MKRKQVTCKCSAYKFPHRKNSGECKDKQENGVWRRVDVDDWKFIPHDTRY